MPSAVVVFIVIAVLMVVVPIAARRAARKRTEAMRLVAESMGFGFEPAASVDVIVALGPLPIYERGHSRKVENLLSGRVGGCEARIFDYDYITGSGKQRQLHTQTVVLYPGAAPNLPELLLSPDNPIFHLVGQVTGAQDVEFDTNPAFSSAYIVRGPDEAAIRAALSAPALSLLEQHRGWWIQARGGTIAFHKAAICRPENVRALLEETQVLLGALAPA